MLLRILGWIPLLQCLTYFPVSAHKTASKKFFVLLTLTSLPVIFAAVLSPIPAGDADVIEKLILKLREAINVSELFVYTATFLTPVLYLIFEKYSGIPPKELGERVAQGMKGMFTGYGLVAFLSFLVMFFTAIAYGSLKVDASAFKTSFLNHYLVTYSFWVYLFGLYCWYLSLLSETWNGDFVGASRSAENVTADAFAARINKYERGD